MMEIKHNATERGGEFVIEENGNRAAEMTYTKAGENKISIDHTFVEHDFRGEGIAKDLVAEGVKFARENNLKIIPLCPYAKAAINKTPEYKDVLAD
jgi:uncharacterized protein